jgi:Cof subfamily protein (haloacid dehalogenase superfamily)
VAYKLVALDLDDTLLNAEFEISPRNREAIRRVVEQGIGVTIATGRMYRSALRYARELAIDLPLILYQGAMIREAASGNMLHYRPVPRDLTVEVLRLAAAENYHLNLYIDDQLFIGQETEESRLYQAIAPIPVQPVGDLCAFLTRQAMEPTKLSIINLDGRLPDLELFLKSKYAGRLTVMQSRPYFLEITSVEATKGQALKHLAELQHIRMDEIVAIGDNYNDLDMLRMAGMGVAMANAPAAVKEAADLITASNLEDGVALFLERYILNGQHGD